MSLDDPNEAGRLGALHSYDILDTGPEECFDRLARLAAALFGTSMAAICFLDTKREWRKALVGLASREVARADSLCAQVLADRDALVLPDLGGPSPAGAEADGWRFYAAAPLVTPDGFVLGALAVMDRVRRAPTLDQLDGLRTLAQAVMAQLELDRYRRDAAEPQHERFRQLADSMPYIVWSANPEGLIDFANQAILDYAGIPDISRIGQQWIELLHPDDVDRTIATWMDSVRTGEVFSAEYRLRRADHSYRWHLAKGMPIRDGKGNIVRWYGTTTDIHDMKLAYEEIGRLAFYDTLTRLPNRQLLMDRLAHAVTLHTRVARMGAVLLLDLDNFKVINDTIGHDNGDLLLDLVAKRLVASVAARDTVARLGGDEFVIILEDIGACNEAAAPHASEVARRILDALSSSFNLDGHERHITPSIGVTLFGDVASTTTELLKRADLAMYQAKAAGRNTVRFFDPKIQAAALARAGLEAELRHGLQRGEFLLHYQPQLDSEGTVTGVEALVRWQNPHRGMVSPAEFIPLAEDTGLILPLGRWVLEEACAQLVRMASDPATEAVHVAVNVSALQFRQPGFVAGVLAVLAESGAAPQRLKIELTESMLLEDIESAIGKIRQLRKHGVCFSLDDFGTGYSSLAYLKRLPLDQLKIDQSFVRNLLSDRRDLAIVDAIIALGRAMQIGVIAEGVETPAQRELLGRCGCNSFQGYLFSRPLPREQLHAFLTAAPKA
ncbi:bifunctional diguanylate cyclase/phosphodiesterase [Massilia sp. ST3]|uniref:putative bifunctional diguanylate cyclase/phosphodiesterase n=1 Tax=Massilia sp. ST3 TaxID=2824903 RepID=UPI001B83C50C|nr:EAL domain-containing protein [Massilia sp. ST3]MBQ5947913.1 EAL domain-containing protein [Massilia sp. ST3]